ncbi:mCG1033824, partial [Mus musculus]
VESKADKKAHHNAMERKLWDQDHIKDSFNHLRSSVTLLQGENGIPGSNPRQSNRVYPIYAKEKP